MTTLSLGQNNFASKRTKLHFPVWSRLGNVIENIKEEICTEPQWKFSFVRRDANKATHLLSKFAVQQDMDNEWVVPPNCECTVAGAFCFSLNLFINEM
jgi:hypothetical protein